jgi:hypothetical protein
MLKRLLRPLLEPIAAKLDKLLDRTSEGFKKQQERQSDARSKQSERMNMLSRQVDESRDEIIRGFARQEAKLAAMKKQLDQVLVRLTTLGVVSAGRGEPAIAHAYDAAAPSNTQTPDPAHDQMVEMMLTAGDNWLASQEQMDVQAPISKTPSAFQNQSEKALSRRIAASEANATPRPQSI